MKTEIWRQTIIELTAAEVPENPFLEVELWAYFTGPSGRVIKREAYWDGGKSYKIAFAPTELGVWTWELTDVSEKACTGLDGSKGELEAVAYTGDLAIYKHGFLKVSEDKYHLTYADGTPFFWLGDTHWEFAYNEKWEESNHPQMDSMFCGMIDRRVEQGYNVYQSNMRCDPPMFSQMERNPRYWEESSKEDLPNIDFYQNELDRRMHYCADKGLVNAVGLGWFSAVDKGVETQKHMIRYFMARYGALPVVWTLAGEIGGYYPAMRQFHIDTWRELARYQESLDGYGTLQTAHYTNERPFADYYQEESWHDFTLNQAGHGDQPINAAWYYDFHDHNPQKPFIEGEAFYEFVSTLEENGSRICTPYMVRRVAYMSIQTGGCGYTYGAQGIWDVVWEKGHQNGAGFNKFDITWWEAIDGVAGYQMGYMKKFYEEQHFEQFRPLRQTEVNTANPFESRMPITSKSLDGNRLILYYTENISPWTRNVIHGVENGSYQGQWFDPQTGSYQPMAEPLTVAGGEFAAPRRPTGDDWVLVLERQ